MSERATLIEISQLFLDAMKRHLDNGMPERAAELVSAYERIVMIRRGAGAP